MRTRVVSRYVTEKNKIIYWVEVLTTNTEHPGWYPWPHNAPGFEAEKDAHLLARELSSGFAQVVIGEYENGDRK